jgi:hypothetical protein
MFLVSEVDLLDLFKAGHQKLVQVKTLNRILMPMRVWFRLQSDVWVDLQWVMTRLSKDKNLWWSLFSARPKFEPSEDFVQVVLCSLGLLGSVVGTRFAVCFDRDHAFSLDLCYGRVWTWIGSSTFVKLIVIIQGLGSAIE